MPCEIIVATPAPVSPSAGKPASPKISSAFSAILQAVTTVAIAIGVRVLRSARCANSSVSETASIGVEPTTSER
jgi:hypothetical protein